LRAWLGTRSVEVVAHDDKLVFSRALGRMDTDLGRWELEDQPAGMVLDVLPAEDVANHGAHRVGLRRVEQHVRRDDRHQSVLTSEMSSPMDAFASPKSITVFGL